MSGLTRQRPCDRCNAQIVAARLPNGRWMALEPYPDPAGPIRVEVLTQLRVLRRTERSTRATKRYEPHRCVPQGRPRPQEQLPLAGGS